MFSCRQQLKDLVSVFLFFKFIFTGRFVLFHFHVICLGVIRQAVIDHLLRLLNYNTLVQKTGYMSLRLLALCYQFQTIIIIIMEQAYCRMLLSSRPIHKDCSDQPPTSFSKYHLLHDCSFPANAIFHLAKLAQFLTHDDVCEPDFFLVQIW